MFSVSLKLLTVSPSLSLSSQQKEGWSQLLRIRETVSDECCNSMLRGVALMCVLCVQGAGESTSYMEKRYTREMISFHKSSIFSLDAEICQHQAALAALQGEPFAIESSYRPMPHCMTCG